MAADSVVYKNAYVWIDSSDLSAQCAEATINFKSEMLDRTAMGDTTRNRRGGLFVWDVALKFHQAWATAVDSVLFPLVGTSAALEIRPLNSCTTSVNPRWTGVGCLESYQPLGGGVGSLLSAPVTFQSAGALARSTTAT